MSDESSQAGSSAQLNVPHLARLARLALTGTGQSAHASAAEVLAEDLAKIMRMVDQMQAIDTDGVEPMAHPLDATQRLREDRVTESVNPEHFQTHAPATEDGFYLVPRVVE